MTISTQQKQLVSLLRKGYSLRITRSIITQAPANCELRLPGKQSSIAEIPWWRIERLLEAGVVRLNSIDAGLATEILAAEAGSKRGARKNSAERCEASPKLVTEGFDFRPLEAYWRGNQDIAGPYICDKIFT